MMSRSLFWVAVLGLFALLGSARPAAASGAIVGQPLAVCVAAARPDMTAATVLRSSGGFDCNTPQIKFGPGDYWVVSGPVPAAVEGGVRLGVRSGSLWQRKITLYALYPDGEIVRRVADDVQTARNMQLGAIVSQQLPYRPAAPVRLAWHVEGSANMRGILLGVHLATSKETASANLGMAAIYAAFAGLAAALAVHNLMMWRVLRQRFQLWYVAMLVGILTYAFSSSGALSWAWPDLPNTFRIRVNYLTLAMAAVAALGFARSFFEPRVFEGWLSRSTTVIGAALLASAMLFAIGLQWQVHLIDMIYRTCFAALIAVVVPMLWRAWRLRSDHFWVYTLAWAAPVLFAALRVANNAGTFGYSFWIDNSTLLAMAAEALGSSFAIAYRMRQLARDRDTARAEELAARMLADIDPLTGLLNRRAFLSKAIGRDGHQMLLILDLDRFKTVNETIGHDGGDEVLRRVARVLRAHCPTDGLATRFGGEEFALLCPAESGVSADLLVNAIRETRMPFDLRVTVSIGSCAGPVADEKDWKMLYRNADQALFAAKDAGRDRARARPIPTALAA